MRARRMLGKGLAALAGITALALAGAGPAAAQWMTGPPTLANGGAVAAGPPGQYRHVERGRLARELRAVQRSTHGKVLEMRLLPHSKPGLVAVVARGDTILYVTVTDHHHVRRLALSETPQHRLKPGLREDIRDLSRARLTPLQAVHRAERATGAPAVDVALARPLSPTNNVLAYQVEVVQHGTPERIAIDGRTGQVIADPRTVLTPRTPVRLAQADVRHTASAASRER